jgi:hypothetical protein
LNLSLEEEEKLLSCGSLSFVCVSLLASKDREKKLKIEHYPKELEEELVYDVYCHLEKACCCKGLDAEGCLLER